MLKQMYLGYATDRGGKTLAVSIYSEGGELWFVKLVLQDVDGEVETVILTPELGRSFKGAWYAGFDALHNPAEHFEEWD